MPTKSGPRTPGLKLPAAAARQLAKLAKEYKGSTRLPKPNVWKKYSQADLWKVFLYQVVVVGGAGPTKKLDECPDASRLLSFAALSRMTEAQRRKAVHTMFRKHSVRYTWKKCSACRKTTAVLKNFERLREHPGGPRGFITDIIDNCKKDERAAIDRLQMHFIKQKGARDLAIELGIAKNTIALDARILTLLNKAGCKLNKQRVQGDRDTYMAVHDAVLAQVARPARLNGAQLDRVLFQNYKAIGAALTARSFRQQS